MAIEVDCTEYDCGLSFNTPDELFAHLKWDHNYSDLKAEVKIEEAIAERGGLTGNPEGK